GLGAARGGSVVGGGQGRLSDARGAGGRKRRVPRRGRRAIGPGAARWPVGESRGCRPHRAGRQSGRAPRGAARIPRRCASQGQLVARTTRRRVTATASPLTARALRDAQPYVQTRSWLVIRLASSANMVAWAKEPTRTPRSRHAAALGP